MENATMRPTQRRCDLLELPKELRLMIYELSLQSSKITIVSYDTPSLSGLSQEQIAKTRYFAQLPDESCSPQLLQVCRQLNEEAIPVLYTTSYLQFRPSYWHEKHEAEDNYRIVDVSRLRTAHPFDKLRVDLIVAEQSINEDISHSKHLLASMKHAIFAKRVLFVIHDGLEYVSKPGRPKPVMEGLKALLHLWSPVAKCHELRVRYRVEDEVNPKETWRKIYGEAWEGRHLGAEVGEPQAVDGKSSQAAF